LAFLGDPFVRFSRTLDPVMELAGAVRKLAHDLVKTVRCHPERIAAAQLNFLTYPKPMRGHARLHCGRGSRADVPLRSPRVGCRNPTVASSCRAAAGACRAGVRAGLCARSCGG